MGASTSERSTSRWLGKIRRLHCRQKPKKPIILVPLCFKAKMRSTYCIYIRSVMQRLACIIFFCFFIIQACLSVAWKYLMSHDIELNENGTKNSFFFLMRKRYREIYKNQHNFWKKFAFMIFGDSQQLFLGPKIKYLEFLGPMFFVWPQNTVEKRLPGKAI